MLAATAQSGYSWRTVATLSTPGTETDQWVGNACLTGSGRRVVVAFAPRAFTNSEQRFDRGAATAVVDLVSGLVTRLPLTSTLAYFSPGCGSGETAVITQSKTDDRAQTRLFTVDAATGKVATPVVAEGQLTSAVQTPDGLVAAVSDGLVRVTPQGRLTRLAGSNGVPFHLNVDGDGQVVFMDRAGDRVRIRRAPRQPGVPAATLASGALGAVGMTTGAGGHVFMTGTATVAGSLPSTVTQLQAPRDAQVSSLGQLAVAPVKRSRESVGPGADEPVASIGVTVIGTGKKLSFTVPFSAPPQSVAAPRPTTPGPKASATTSTALQAATVAGSPTNPVDDDRWCSVPRNDPANQAMQPLPRQVEWAVDQAVTGSLTVQRTANWKNLGMPAYTPQGLFPRIGLLGGGRVPAQILLGIAAQESNLWQASPHALPGVTGNALIGNFYGRDVYNDDATDDWDIHWDQSDCGYGVLQVTDGMRLAGHEKPGETSYPYQTQRAVALDFATNVAAGLRILEAKWNQLKNAGITINDGTPDHVENWFYALWAYNNGVHPKGTGSEPWGLGWMNNPVNPRFPADRTPFMAVASDATHPQDWPYPEKVIGWAGNPIDSLVAPDTFEAGYRPAWWTSDLNKSTAKPPVDMFCIPLNDCHPGSRITPDDPSVAGEPAGPCAHKNAAGFYDLQCWINVPRSWKNCVSGECGYELLRFDPGYAYQPDATTNYPPTCSLTGLPAGALVVDNVPTGTSSVRPCAKSYNSVGRFDLRFDVNGSGLYRSKIDFHQIGGGLGGHFWFARTWSPVAASRLNSPGLTGTWSLDRRIDGWSRVMVHIPDFHAHTQQARYKIDLGDGRPPRERVLLQRTRQQRWVSLGVFKFTGVPKVSLSNITADGEGEEDIAWDAIAFQPLPHKPANLVVALGDSYSSGEGASTDEAADYYPETNNRGGGIKTSIAGDTYEWRYGNACHRSRYAWPRLARLSDSSLSVGSRADMWDPEVDHQLLACSGAQTENVLPSTPAFVGEKITNAWGQGATGQYREPSQLDRGFLDENTTLVTISIGGNDASFGPILEKCLLSISPPAPACQEEPLAPDTRPLKIAGPADVSAKVKPSVETVLRAIHRRAPNAKIVLMGYPRLISDGGSCLRQTIIIKGVQTQLGLSTTEAAWLNGSADYLAGELSALATSLSSQFGTPVVFGDPRPDFQGKAACGTPESLHAVITSLTEGESEGWPFKSLGASQQSFHPNRLGTPLYAAAMNRVIDQLGR
ncbi:hypothetical protein [Kribbella sp. NPDC006257]|uniref:hypothetical protein n=1 Tax=Kribbella sp. NPDC006257 TaxID=3156738 RepID=UPI0033BBF893